MTAFACDCSPACRAEIAWCSTPEMRSRMARACVRQQTRLRVDRAPDARHDRESRMAHADRVCGLSRGAPCAVAQARYRLGSPDAAVEPGSRAPALDRGARRQ